MRLRDRMLDDLKLAGYSPATMLEYERCVRKLTDFIGKPPLRVNAEDVRRFLLELANDWGLSASTRKVYVCAFRFFFRTTRPSSIAPGPTVGYSRPRCSSIRNAQVVSPTSAHASRFGPAPSTEPAGRFVARIASALALALGLFACANHNPTGATAQDSGQGTAPTVDVDAGELETDAGSAVADVAREVDAQTEADGDSIEDVPPPKPLGEGYMVLVHEDLAEGVSVTLGASEQAVAAIPQQYDGLSVTLRTEGDLVDAFSQLANNPAGGVLDMQPDGRSFDPPLLVRATWPEGSLTDEQARRVRLFTIDDGELTPMTVVSRDLEAREFTALVDHFSDKLIGVNTWDVEAVRILSPAVEGQPLHVAVDFTGGGVPSRARCTASGVEYPCNAFTIPSPSTGFHDLLISDTTPWLGTYVPGKEPRRWNSQLYVSPAGVDYDAWEQAAERFSPVLRYSEFHEDSLCDSSIVPDSTTRYVPVSVEGIFTGSPTIELGGTKYTGKDNILNALATQGQRGDLINAQGSKDLAGQGLGPSAHPTLYWHVAFPNGTDDLSRVFLTYWMLYPWDPKSPELRGGAHSVDRDSLVVVLDCSARSAGCSATGVIYGAHEEGQYVYLLEPTGERIAARWHGDMLRVPWYAVWKEDDHPVAYVAYGSHALYPRPGVYYVDPGWNSDAEGVGAKPYTDLLVHGGREPACGDGIVRRITGSGLRRLDMAAIDSQSPEAERAFLFSGFWIDSAGGIFHDNGRFPPFIDRYADIGAWFERVNALNAADGWCFLAECLLCVDLPSVPDAIPEGVPVGMSPYCADNGLVTCTDGVPQLQSCTGQGKVCEWDANLASFACTPPPCEPDCAVVECGPDPACGVECGTCGLGDVCDQGSCVPECTPDCSGQACGPDPICGVECGPCPGTEVCNTSSLECQPACLADCADKVCGVDGCGGVCGTCAADATCDPAADVCVSIGANASYGDTGQTRCYDASAEAPCPAVGEPFHGQDGQYGGGAIALSSQGDGTVVHLATELVWQAGEVTAEIAWADAWSYCAGLSLGGHDDWRLPSLLELELLVDHGTHTPALNTAYFPEASAAAYWANTRYGGDSARSWTVDFADGVSGNASNTALHWVRCVRAGAMTCQPSCGGRVCGPDGCGGDCGVCGAGQTCRPDGTCGVGVSGAWPLSDTTQRTCYDASDEVPCPLEGEPFYGQDAQVVSVPPNFQVTGPTAVDNVDQLEWQRLVDLREATFDEAMAYCETLALAGHQDWRLPTRHEIGHLVDYTRFKPALDPYLFPETQQGQLWTSTAYAGSDDSAWTLDVEDGDIGYSAVTEPHEVRCVRGEASCETACGAQACGLDQCGRDCGFCAAGHVCDRAGCVAHATTTPWPQSDTTQHGCYDASAEVPCPGAGEPFLGQDGQYHGNPSTMRAISADVVSDDVSGLMWERGISSTDLTWAAAEVYCATRTFGGHADWRLPTREEVIDLVDFTRFKPALDAIVFPGSPLTRYWTATSYAGTSDNRWTLDLIDGVVGDAAATDTYRAKCVRGEVVCQPQCEGKACGPDYCGGDCGFCGAGTVCGAGACVSAAQSNVWPTADTGQATCYDASGPIACPAPGEPFHGQDAQYHGNTTGVRAVSTTAAVDDVTGRMWQRGVSETTLSWDDATSYCADLALDGHSDWRLPTRQEISSLVNYTRYKPALDAGLFPGGNLPAYWTATSYAGADDNAWRLEPEDGVLSYAAKTTHYLARCVR